VEIYSPVRCWAHHSIVNEKDNIIVVDPKGNMNGFSRSRMIQSKTYMACTNVGNLQEMGVVDGVPSPKSLCEYTIYVPQKTTISGHGILKCILWPTGEGWSLRCNHISGDIGRECGLCEFRPLSRRIGQAHLADIRY
jgi:hypothetical protein